MNSYFKLTVVKFKLYLREPAAFFFGLVFPLMLLALTGAIYGNEPAPVGSPFYHGPYGYIDSYIPALTAMVIGTVAMLTIPVATANNRELKVLRRFQATPMRPLVYLAADVTVYYLLALLSMALLIVVGRLAFDLRFAGNWGALLLAFSLGMFAFTAAGYVIGSLAPTGRVAQVVGQVIYFPMMFLSGAAIPLELMPDNIAGLGSALPMTAIVTMLRDIWFGAATISWTPIVTLAAILVIGLIVSTRTFRWE